MHQVWNPERFSRQQGRHRSIAANANHDVGLELPQDLARLAKTLGQFGENLQPCRYSSTCPPAHLNRLQRPPQLRQHPRLQTSLGADKKNITLRLFFFKLLSQRNRREKVSTGASTGQQQFHRNSPGRLLDTFNNMPIAASVVIRLVPP